MILLIYHMHNTLFPKTNITCDFLNVLCNIHIVRHYDAESFNCQLERESERESFVQLCFLVNEHLWIKYWFGRLYVVAKLYRYSSQVCVCVCVFWRHWSERVCWDYIPPVAMPTSQLPSVPPATECWGSEFHTESCLCWKYCFNGRTV